MQLGKPEDAADAARMLHVLAASSHEVHSAISVHDTTSGETHTLVNTTVVWMRDYSDAEVAEYIQSGDPLDKAGAYAIQHPTFRPAERVQGCLSGVVGLPLGDLRELLSRVGIEIPRAIVPVCEAKKLFACCQRE
jgi:predicted house-cleaning NTP pyrophosphatase (Maf/HAM1 superfamily)